MVFSSVLISATELEFSRTSLWSMVNILDLLHCFSFQFIRNGSATKCACLLFPGMISHVHGHALTTVLWA